MNRWASGLILGTLPSMMLWTAALAHADEAPIGFDNLSNGLVDQDTFQADFAKFGDVKTISGLGPLYSAQSECHQNPVSDVAARSPNCEPAISIAGDASRTRASRLLVGPS
jgi:hypothetical protein